jgi:protein-arginine kinase activator protein McsA
MIRCQHCDCLWPFQHRRQRTQYVNDESNWVYLCESCTKVNNEYWNDRWADYYSDVLM